MVDVKSGTEDHLHQKYVNIKNYENNDSLSICRIRLVQGKPQLGHAKHSTRRHAARGPQIGQSWSKAIVESKSALQKIYF